MSKSISLVVPVFAEPTYVDQMLRSILNLEEKPNELVLVDDLYSTETSLKLEKFEEIYPSKIFLLKNNTNLGISESTKRALNVVTSNFVGFLDSDDLLMPNAISRFKKKIGRSKIYTSEFLAFNDDGTKNEIKSFSRTETLNYLNLTTKDWQKVLLFENLISHFRVVKTDIAKSFNWTSKIDGIQDILLNYSLALDESIVFDTEVTYLHRIHNNQTTNLVNQNSTILKNLNSARVTWRSKIGWKSGKDFNLDSINIDSKLFKKLKSSNTSNFFMVDLSGNIRLINFIESMELLNSQNFIGCYLSNYLDEYFIRRALICIYGKTAVPVGLFVDSREINQLRFLRLFSGLFDFIVLENENENSNISPYIPKEIKILK